MNFDRQEEQARLVRGTDPVDFEAEASVVFIHRPILRDLALVPLWAFHTLSEYSASLPTGQRFGKMWKCNRGDLWLLGQYHDIGDPNVTGIRWYELRVAEVFILNEILKIFRQ